MRKTGRDVFVDARETSPEAATPQAYLDAHGALDPNRSENGPWSAGIPGLPAALVELARKYGKLPLKTTLAPAIRIARDGFPVYARLERGYASRRAVMERYPGTRAVYLADGDPPQVGETLKQPDLARTLELLADQGFDGFYRGDVAAQADRRRYARKAASGPPTTSPATGCSEREPLRFRYRDWDIITAPPPSSGGIALAEILQIARGLGPAQARSTRIACTSWSRRCAARSAIARSISAIRISCRCRSRA